MATMQLVPQQFISTLSHYTSLYEIGRSKKIKHSCLIGSYEIGGLKDVDVVGKLSSRKFLWIKKPIDSNNCHPWKVVAEQLLCKVGDNDMFHTNLQLSDPYRIQIKKIPLFCQQLKPIKNAMLIM